MLASCILRSVVAPCNLLLLSPTPTTRFFLGYPLLVSCSNPPKRFSSRKSSRRSTSGFRVACGLLPVDPWSPDVDSQSIASQLFAVSLFPYFGFLYYITRSKTAPKLTLFGFYFLLAFVGATIPAGIYGNFLSETSSSHVFANLFGVGMKGYHFYSTAKVHYGTSLSNVDWLHGAAESLLTFTNLFIVLGLMGALRKIKDGKKNNPSVDSKVEEKTSI